MNDPIDQLARARFATELHRNFSVVAAAGSGKTRAITERIVQIARGPQASEQLPNLVVVTYTHRAANEMQQRARQKILEARIELPILAAFNRAFFGTIHSFCVKLLAAHGHYLGLPPRMDLIDDDEELWNDFVQRQQVVGRSLEENARRILFRHVEVRRLMELGRRGGIGEQNSFANDPCPALDFSRLLAFQTTSKQSVSTVDRTQKALREFESLVLAGAEFVPLPQRVCHAQAFVKIWRETFDPFRSWLNRAALRVAAEVENEYRDFRLTRGALTYDDQVALARALFGNAEAAQRIRRKNYRVILDEAQDTAPSQFSVLLEAARPPEATGSWPNESVNPPRAGHFSMVGDFQQSIFGHHADLRNYRRIHDALVVAPGGEALEFSVTFRLDRQSLDLINASFGALLSGQGDQVNFMNLNPRPELLPGQVLRVDLVRSKDLPSDTPERRRAAWEATEVARWICRAGLTHLRARSWSEVAILCPRKAWFEPLRDALRRAHLKVQIQSEKACRGDNPAYAWLTALLTVLAESHCHYEIVGVLREVFGLSDHDLAVFSEGKGYRFDLEHAHEGKDTVSAKLKLLAEIRRAIRSLPLFTAVSEVIKTIQLRERLRVLPLEDFENLEGELDRLLGLAANAEAEGLSLREFAKNLRSNFLAQREPPAADDDAIQLITSQKAKGSEWQAVIVPFLARPITFGNLSFPRLLPASLEGEQVVALGPDDITPELKDALERGEREEMERLLYVAVTRAKHSLVLVGDAELFLRKSGRVPSKSQMKWLRCETGGCNEENFKRLATEAAVCPETQAIDAASNERERRAQNIPPLPKITAKSKEAALKQARNFLRRINPSEVAETSGAEIIATSDSRTSQRAGAFDNAATRYGHWWHTFLQKLDWKMPPADWETIFAEVLPSAPDRPRAMTEWDLFRSRSGEFRKHFDGAECVAHSEISFALKIDDNRVLEGIIDLALLDLASGCGLIIDWKTNRMSSGEEKKLRDFYRPQLAAYWKASAELTGLRMQAGLYSTSAGSFLLYETEELEREWARLRDLPAPDFREVVVRN